jgi:hypothetical protein
MGMSRTSLPTFNLCQRRLSHIPCRCSIQRHIEMAGEVSLEMYLQLYAEETTFAAISA